MAHRSWSYSIRLYFDDIMTNYHSIGGAVTLGVFGGEIIAVITDLRWMIIFCVALILADFWWGWRESSLRKEQAVTRAEKEKHKFHFSLAGRRTLNKTVDYMSYLLIGALAGLAITEPMGLCNHTVTAAIGIGLGCMFEVSSIIGHVCYVKGWDIQINWGRLIVAFLKFKWKELGDIFEEGIEKIDDNRNPRHHHNHGQMDDYELNEDDMHNKHKGDCTISATYNDDDAHHCGEDANENANDLQTD